MQSSKRSRVNLPNHLQSQIAKLAASLSLLAISSALTDPVLPTGHISWPWLLFNIPRQANSLDVWHLPKIPLSSLSPSLFVVFRGIEVQGQLCAPSKREGSPSHSLRLWFPFFHFHGHDVLSKKGKCLNASQPESRQRGQGAGSSLCVPKIKGKWMTHITWKRQL